jgi:LuxR family transcriptional regulator, maltose regulon positive regulatory protein
MAEAPAPVSDAYDALFRPPLLTTKLYLPPARSNLVPRPRLIERLNAGSTHRLTLISAPAGFGKTTLLSAWIPQSHWCVAWVSLDEGDNDPTRFWSYFISAIQMLESHLGQNALRLLESPQRLPFDLILTSLLNDLTAFRQELAVVLDDYHVIENLAIHEALTFLLDHLPPQVHLIMTTRVDPPLPLARLRARGQLIELGVADLRFTSAEVTKFLNEVMGLPLTAQDIAALEERTEGWIAGLQLAALAMRDQPNLSGFVSAFTGSNRFVVDYLTTEVLARQPAHVQTFLLQTAILERLCGPLCDVVMGIAEVAQPPSSSISPAAGQPASVAHSYSQILLEALERANLFLLPLDNDRRWYRYHHLFAEVLRGRLASGATAEMVTTLHRRAAAWCEQHGFVTEAMEHLLAGKVYEQAASLVERTAEEIWTQGQIPLLLDWFSRLPIEVIRARPYLCVYCAWAFFIAGQFDLMEIRLRDAEQALTPQLPESDWNDILGMLAVIRSAASDDPQEIMALTRQALELLSERKQAWRGSAYLSLGLAYKNLGEVRQASQALIEAVTINQSAKNMYAGLFAMSNLAEVQMAQGQLRAAAQTYQTAMQFVEIDHQSKRSQAYLGWAYVGWGRILYEWDKLDDATKYLEMGLGSQEKMGDAGNLPLGYLAMAKIQAASGNLDGAVDLIRQARAARGRWNTPQTEMEVGAYEARLHLRQNNMLAVERWIKERQLNPADTTLIPREVEYLTLARALITQSSLEPAASLLEHLIKTAEMAERIASVIETLNLRALVLQTQGNLTEALAALERALTLAEPEGYVRIFVDEGKPMAEVLGRMKDEGGRLKDYIDRLLSAFPKNEGETLRVKGEEESMTMVPSSLHPSPLIPHPLVEPLSDREWEVLHLIAAGLTNQEIADQLVIVLSTAKRHTINIYGKLGVSNRTQAVAKARELNLL